MGIRATLVLQVTLGLVLMADRQVMVRIGLGTLAIIGGYVLTELGVTVGLTLVCHVVILAPLVTLVMREPLQRLFVGLFPVALLVTVGQRVMAARPGVTGLMVTLGIFMLMAVCLFVAEYQMPTILVMAVLAVTAAALEPMVLEAPAVEVAAAQGYATQVLLRVVRLAVLAVTLAVAKAPVLLVVTGARLPVEPVQVVERALLVAVAVAAVVEVLWAILALRVMLGVWQTQPLLTANLLRPALRIRFLLLPAVRL